MPEAMPKSVVWYERIAYCGVASGIPMLILTWSNTAHYLKLNPLLYPFALIVFFSVQVLWIWLVARKRQNWARWVTGLAPILALPGLITEFQTRYQLDPVATAAYYSIYLLFCAAAVLLFMPDARGWFQKQKTRAVA